MTIRGLIRFVWLSPLTVLMWGVYVLPLWGLGFIRFESFDRGAAVYRWARPLHTTSWWGFALPCAVVYRDDLIVRLLRLARLAEHPSAEQPIRSLRRLTLEHEFRHIEQMYRWGVLFYLAYVVAGLWAGLRGRSFYFDNWFERDARRFADRAVIGSDDPP